MAETDRLAWIFVFPYQRLVLALPDVLGRKTDIEITLNTDARPQEVGRCLVVAINKLGSMGNFHGVDSAIIFANLEEVEAGNETSGFKA